MGHGWVGCKRGLFVSRVPNCTASARSWATWKSDGLPMERMSRGKKKILFGAMFGHSAHQPLDEIASDYSIFLIMRAALLALYIRPTIYPELSLPCDQKKRMINVLCFRGPSSMYWRFDVPHGPFKTLQGYWGRRVG